MRRISRKICGLFTQTVFCKNVACHSSTFSLVHVYFFKVNSFLEKWNKTYIFVLEKWKFSKIPL